MNLLNFRLPRRYYFEPYLISSELTTAFTGPVIVLSIAMLYEHTHGVKSEVIAGDRHVHDECKPVIGTPIVSL
jgi:hypothetical protein